MKKLIAALFLIAGMTSMAHAFPTRYVQISTNTPTQQTGNINIQGATISTSTLTSVAISSITTQVAMGSHKITGLANGTASTDAATIGQVSGHIVSTPVSANGTTSTSITNGTMTQTVVTCSITPVSTSSKVLVLISAHVQVGSTAQPILCSLYRNNTTNLMDSTGGVEVGTTGLASDGTAAMVWLDSPSTTSSTAYTMFCSNGTGTGTSNVGNGRTWSVVLVEVQ